MLKTIIAASRCSPEHLEISTSCTASKDNVDSKNCETGPWSLSRCSTFIERCLILFLKEGSILYEEGSTERSKMAIVICGQPERFTFCIERKDLGHPNHEHCARELKMLDCGLRQLKLVVLINSMK